MYLPTGLLFCLAALAFAAPQAVDYGPCDINGNDDCKEIMDNTACFLNPVGADEIFKCITGGREGRPRPKQSLNDHATTTPNIPSPLPKTRIHPPTYHHPLLLTNPPARTALLTWFTHARTLRPMPWRQPFQPPQTLTRSQLSRRAYEVWISEVMLQQTRVATVVAYWTRWMARWPRIGDLAAAGEEEVLGVWQGLGYYSRARRVWLAAREVCEVGGGDGGEDGDGGGEGILPGTVEGLMRLPGVGRYTAGAVAAIVFGVAAPMVDGNVLRVLSRQMGLLADVKADKKAVDMLWEAAGDLAKAVAGDGEDGDKGVNERPGQWGQALMELGSTVCTPKPNCAACPITETCRAYAEGLSLAEGRGKDRELTDIEDGCNLCAPIEEAASDGDEADKETEPPPSKGDGKLSRFFADTKRVKQPNTAAQDLDARTLAVVVNHARKFPLRKPKKKVREEETLVCAVRGSDGRYLIHKRPDKGLLGGLWELPSQTLPPSNDSTAKTRKARATSYVAGVAGGKGSCSPPLKHVAELGSVPWLFSHLKLTMHVHLFEMDGVSPFAKLGPREQWISVHEIDAESMGTGMKKCWSLVKEKMAEVDNKVR
ncbi:DNA glycosylase [Chaetomium tenue]|uniref:DNA glycosylase n=1 Tax=Chaetomium tenue TaxID=1854479 RepID=A0ACB7PLT5_9PEZI|nr:DNA glycosylase [Chaetomium globosum]